MKPIARCTRTGMYVGLCLLILTVWSPAIGATQGTSTPALDMTSTPEARWFLIDEEASTFTDYESGWSMSWNPDFWKFPHTTGNGHFGLRATHETEGFGIAFTARVVPHPGDAQGRTWGRINYADWTYDDPSECLDLGGGEEDLLPMSEVARGTDGQPLSGSTETRAWVVNQHPSEGYLIYIECRVLVPGSSYLLLMMNAPSQEDFNVVAPSLEALLATIRIAEPEGTPSPSPAG